MMFSNNGIDVSNAVVDGEINPIDMGPFSTLGGVITTRTIAELLTSPFDAVSV